MCYNVFRTKEREEVATSPSERLTQRQYEVGKLVCENLTYDEIAERLGITRSTVKVHIDALRMKLGVEKKRHIPQAMRAMGLVD